MAHNLSIRKDGIVEMFSGSGLTPWHKLGTVVQGVLTSQEAIEAAKLGWKVDKSQIYLRNPETGELEAQAGNFGIQRQDSGEMLGFARGRYHCIQNVEAFEFFDNVVASNDAIYDTAGAIDGGKKVWIMAKIPKKLFLASDPSDTFEQMILLSTSHDGLGALSMQHVSTRVVCQNTLSVALSSATNKINIRHTRNFNQKIEAAQKALQLAVGYQNDLIHVMNELSKEEMNKKGMEKFAELLLPARKENEEESTRTAGMREELVTLFSRGIGNKGRSKYDALNAVTEFVDHHKGTRVTEGTTEGEQRFKASLFGAGAKLKQEAFDLLTA